MITSVVTRQGRILQNKQVNGATIKFTRVVASTSYVPTEELKDQTAIYSVVQTLSIQSITQNEAEQYYELNVMLENTQLVAAYNLSQIGFFANDPDEGEILFAIAQLEPAKKIDIPSVTPGYTLEMHFRFKNSENANVEVNFDSKNLMSRAGVEAMLEAASFSGRTKGHFITLTDGTDAPLLFTRLLGKSDQVKTNGYQLFDESKIPTTTHRNATVTNNGDGSFTVSGSGIIAEDHDFGVNHVYTHEETVALLKSAGTFRFLSNVSTRPYVYAVFLQNGESIGEINNRETTNMSMKITEDVFNDETFRLRIGFYGFKSDNVIPGTVKPMFYKDGNGDGTLELFTGGKPGPNPEYPQTIYNGAESGSVTIKNFKKNILDKTAYTGTYKDISFTENANGSCSAKGVASELVVMGITDVPLQAGVKYYLSGGNELLHLTLRDSKGQIMYATDNGNGEEYTPTEDITATLFFRIEKDVALNTTVYPMLRAAGNNIFEKKKGISIEVPTPILIGIPVSSDGNYTDANGQQYLCDEIDLNRKKHIQRLKKRTFNGTEGDWKINTYNLDVLGVYIFGFYVNDIVLDEYDSPLLCDKLLYQEWGKLTKTNRNKIYNTPGHVQVYLEDQSITTVEAFGEWLSSNPIEVIYTLETPIETDLTDEQMEILENLVTYEGVTTLYTEDKLVVMDIEYFKNTDNGKSFSKIKEENIALRKLIGNVNKVLESISG